MSKEKYQNEKSEESEPQSTKSLVEQGKVPGNIAEMMIFIAEYKQALENNPTTSKEEIEQRQTLLTDMERDLQEMIAHKTELEEMDLAGPNQQLEIIKKWAQRSEETIAQKEKSLTFFKNLEDILEEHDITSTTLKQNHPPGEPEIIPVNIDRVRHLISTFENDLLREKKHASELREAIAGWEKIDVQILEFLARWKEDSQQ